MGKRKKQSRAGEPASGERTLYVCVRDRNGKGASCAGSGARTLLTGMREMLAAEQIGEEELRLRPVGCLGLCKKGPVLVAAIGPAAAEKKPPKPRKKDAGVYTRVEPGEAREVLRAALLGPGLTA